MELELTLYKLHYSRSGVSLRSSYTHARFNLHHGFLWTVISPAFFSLLWVTFIPPYGLWTFNTYRPRQDDTYCHRAHTIPTKKKKTQQQLVLLLSRGRAQVFMTLIFYVFTFFSHCFSFSFKLQLLFHPSYSLFFFLSFTNNAPMLSIILRCVELDAHCVLLFGLWTALLVVFFLYYLFSSKCLFL